jgi:hypothetical protein
MVRLWAVQGERPGAGRTLEPLGGLPARGFVNALQVRIAVVTCVMLYGGSLFISGDVVYPLVSPEDALSMVPGVLCRSRAAAGFCWPAWDRNHGWGAGHVTRRRGMACSCTG